MLSALDRHFPSTARFSRPEAGFFVWVELPAGIDTQALLDRAIASEKIAFVPGQVFAVGDADASRCLRLSFSGSDPAQIEDGVTRLARLL